MSDKLAQRLLARASKEGLQRTRMPDGGEVFSGPLASRALSSLGARAMTMDHTMIVAEDFDLSNPEDQALYAHEQVHMKGSGGTDSHGQRDHEEASARSVERMVLQRAQDGENFSSILRDMKAAPSADGVPEKGQSNGKGAVTAAAGYAELKAQGLSDAAIVRRLTRKVLESLVSSEEAIKIRSTESPSF
jgi:hypothetical protein